MAAGAKSLALRPAREPRLTITGAAFIALSPHALIDANGTNPFWNQDPVDLLQLNGEETVKRMLELDAALMAAPFSHCRRLRRETPAALGSPCR